MNFRSIQGHSAQLQMLERLFSGGKIPHAMLFTGPSGTGKKKIAHRFLNALFCPSLNPPCLECPDCAAFAAYSHPDMAALLPEDRPSIPIGDPVKREHGSVRWLIDFFSKKSISGRSAALIDGLDRISIEGQNALLKSIEEPPPGTVIILISSGRSGILPTILSRCLSVSFGQLSDIELKSVLSGHFPETQRADAIAAASGGSMETALFLAGKNVLNEIEGICGEILNFALNRKYLGLNSTLLRERTDTKKAIISMINVFDHLLRRSLNGQKGVSFFETLPDASGETLAKIIKILLALRKGYSNNLNIRTSLKGMLYSPD